MKKERKSRERNRIAVLLLALVCFAFAFPGCGEGYEKDPNTLVVWGTVINADYQKILDSKRDDRIALYSKKVLETFHAEYPDVKVEVYNMGWGESLNQQFMQSAKGNTLPDIFIGETYIESYAREGLLKEISVEDEILSDIYENTYKPFSIGGKNYGIPLYTGTFGLIYNKSILDEAGIPADKYAPKTWDELLENCETVAEEFKSSSGKNDVGGMLLSCTGSLNAAFYALPFLRQKGAEYVNAQGEISFNDAKATEAYDYIRKLGKTMPHNSVGLSEDALNNIYLNERAAYRLAGPWFYDSVPAAKIDNFGACELPLPEGGIESNVIVGNVVASLTKSCGNVEAATALIKTFLKKDIQGMLIDTYSRLPVLKSSYTGDENLYANKPYVEAFVKGLEAENNIGGLPSFAKNSTRIWDSWLSTYYNIVTTNSGIQNLLDTLQSKTQGLI